MIVGLGGFVFAQDMPDVPAAGLDSPIAGAESGSNADANTSGDDSLFDQLMAKMKRATADVIDNRIWNWRENYWWIESWEAERWNLGWENWTPEDEHDTFAAWKAQLSAAEQAELASQASDAHRRIIASGLN